MRLRVADFWSIRMARWHLQQAKAYRQAWLLVLEAGDGALAAAMIRGHMRHHAREAVAEVRRTKAMHRHPDLEIGICGPTGPQIASPASSRSEEARDGHTASCAAA